MKRLIWILVILLAGCSLKNGKDTNGRAEVTLAPLSAVTETVTPTKQTAAVTLTNTPPPPTPNNTRTTTCVPRSDWPQTYTVQSGDTLAGIAQKVSSTVNDLASGNCIANPGQIQVGQVLRVPFAPLADQGGRPLIAYFTASANPAPCMGRVTLSWQTTNTQKLWIEAFSSDKYGAPSGTPPDQVFSNLPATGTLLFDVNPQLYGTGAILNLLTDADTDGKGASVTQLFLQVTACSPASPQFVSFTASPNPVSCGGVIVLRWETRNAKKAWIEQYDARIDDGTFPPGYYRPDQVFADLPTSGTLTVDLPDHYLEGAFFTLILDTYTAQSKGPEARVDAQVTGCSSSAVELVSFTVSPATANPGETITVAWEVRGAKFAQIEIRHPVERYSQYTEALPTKGTKQIKLSDIPTSEAIPVVLRIDVTGTPSQPSIGPELASTTLKMNCPYAYFFGVGDGKCPTSPAQNGQASFQEFEHGWMVFVPGMNEIFTLLPDGTGYRRSQMAAVEVPTAPTTSTIPFYPPAPVFSNLWSVEYKDILGWGVSPLTTYNMTYQVRRTRYDSENVYFTLPDGRVVSAVTGYGFISQWTAQ